jgi:hypothetical protein
MWLLSSLTRRTDAPTAMYELTDLLHNRRVTRVSAEGLVATVSAWLAELEADSPLVGDLATVVQRGDWVAAHAIAASLSVDVVLAA